MSTRAAFTTLLLTAALVVTARGDDLPTATTAVALPANLKTPLLKRISVDKTPPAALEDLVKRLAEDNKLKIEFDPGFFKEYPDAAKQRIAVPAVRDMRLDLFLDGLVRQAGGTSSCVVKEGTLVFVKPADAVVVRPNKMRAVQTLLQPPDPGHASAVAALKKKLATRTDVEASTDVSLIEFLLAIARKHDFSFQIKGDSFKAAGVPNIAEKKPTVKAAKGTTLDAILRDALMSVGAEYTVDGYGNLSVVPKAADPKK